MADTKDFLRKVNLEYFASGKHRLTLDQFKELYFKDEVVLIDVRTKDENAVASFSFARNIPLEDLPDRLNDIPKDKTSALFCSGKVRSVMAYVFLQAQGFIQSKILDANIEELAGLVKPGFVENLKKKGKLS